MCEDVGGMGMLTAGIVVEMERHPTEMPHFSSLGPPAFCELLALSQQVPKGYFPSYHTQGGTTAGA